MKPSEIKNLTDDEIKQELANLRKRVYRIREDMVVESASNLKEYRSIKKDIARILTVIKERGNNKEKSDKKVA